MGGWYAWGVGHVRVWVLVGVLADKPPCSSLPLFPHGEGVCISALWVGALTGGLCAAEGGSCAWRGLLPLTRHAPCS